MMVAYNPRVPPDRNRMLAPEVAEEVRVALTARWHSPSRDDSALKAALTAAARDARSRQLRPEELLLVLKAIEEAVADTLRRGTGSERAVFHRWPAGAWPAAHITAEAAA